MGQVIAMMTARDSVAYRLFRPPGDLESRADLAPLRAALAAVPPADEPNSELRDEYGLILVPGAHDADAVSRLLAATAQQSFSFNRVAYPKAWFEALAARTRQDRPGAQTAFAAARAEVDRAVQANPGDGRMLSWLAMIDAGLGNREDAVREARRACELTPRKKPLWTRPSPPATWRSFTPGRTKPTSRSRRWKNGWRVPPAATCARSQATETCGSTRSGTRCGPTRASRRSSSGWPLHGNGGFLPAAPGEGQRSLLRNIPAFS